MPVRRHPIANPMQNTGLASVPLDKDLITRLQRSFDEIRPHGAALGAAFYAKLFAKAPQVRPLFRSETAVQAQKLIAALDAVVRNLVNPAENAAMIAALGRRHAGYGATPEHYELVVTLLVEAIDEVMGPRIAPPRLEEWRLVLRLVSDQMIAGGGPSEHGGGLTVHRKHY